jgi:DNA-binding SARP family transcriptional activator
LWNDPSFRAWHPRYERQCATPAAVRELIDMIDEIDVTDMLPRIAVPTLILHRTGDLIIGIDSARRLAAAIRGAELVELDGIDHFPQAGDVESWLREIERFVTGHAAVSHTGVGREAHVTRLITFGGFEVIRDGTPVGLDEWGSRRARTLCKRLATAAGAPVPREVLIELLWPDADEERERLSARLSVQLSAVRRVLNGGVIADRDSVRLDLREVALDVAEFSQAVAAGRLDAAVALHRGEFLPEDLYAEWASATRDQARATYLGCVRGLAERAAAVDDHDGVVAQMRRVLETDPFDTDAHIRLIVTLHRAGHLGEARRAHDSYAGKMRELGLVPDLLGELTAPTRD